MPFQEGCEIFLLNKCTFPKAAEIFFFFYMTETLRELIGEHVFNNIHKYELYTTETEWLALIQTMHPYIT